MAETHVGLVGEPDPDSAVTAKAGPEMSSPGTSESGDYDSNCVFCRIAAGQEPETELFHCEVGGDRPGWWGPDHRSLLRACLCADHLRDPEVSSGAFAVQWGETVIEQALSPPSACLYNTAASRVLTYIVGSLPLL